MHIVNWFPSKPSPQQASWIKKHISALSAYADNRVFHLQVRKGKVCFHNGKNDDGSTYLILDLPFEIWRINEFLSLILLLVVLFKNRHFSYQIINFHIVYPNCTHLHLIRKFINSRILFTEHWSGYHYNFNIPRPGKRRRIQRIFDYNVPLIAVSKALVNDIRNFSKASFPGYVVPNIVDTQWFNPGSGIKIEEKQNFLMISQWKWPKDPFTVLYAWQKVILKYPHVSLIIAGYGEQYADVLKLIKELDLQDHVVLQGELSPEQVAREMKHALALIHCSGYETFSVVCAEALCCGTPVIASQVGGIPEYLHTGNGVLVAENSPEAFYGAIVSFLKHKDEFNRENIAGEAIEKFSEKNVGEQYFSVIKKIIEG